MKKPELPPGIKIVACCDGDGSCGASWWEARSTTGEVLGASRDIRGVRTTRYDDYTDISPSQSPEMAEAKIELVRDVISRLVFLGS